MTSNIEIKNRHISIILLWEQASGIPLVTLFARRTKDNICWDLPSTKREQVNHRYLRKWWGYSGQEIESIPEAINRMSKEELGVRIRPMVVFPLAYTSPQDVGTETRFVLARLPNGITPENLQSYLNPTVKALPPEKALSILKDRVSPEAAEYIRSLGKPLKPA